MKMRTILLSLGIAVVIFAAGLYMVYSSTYSDVSTLATLSSPTRVTVQGSPLMMGVGEATLIINGEPYRARIQGYYGIAEPLSGEGRSYAFFFLTGSDGYSVLALYDAREFTSKYGGSPVFEDTVVVDGVFRPEVTASVQGADLEFTITNIIEVKAILKGCHASYDGEKAVVAG